MEDYTETQNMSSSYLEKGVYEEIIANLDVSASEASELQLNRPSCSYETKVKSEKSEDPRLCYVMNDHNYILSTRNSRISLNVRQNLLDFIDENSPSACSISKEKLVDNVLRLLSEPKSYVSFIEKIEEACDVKAEVCPVLDVCKHEEGDDAFLGKGDMFVITELDSLIKDADKLSDIICLAPESDAKLSLEDSADPVSMLNEISIMDLCKAEDTSEIDSLILKDKALCLDIDIKANQEPKEGCAEFGESNSETVTNDLSLSNENDSSENKSDAVSCDGLEPSEKGKEADSNVVETDAPLCNILEFSEKSQEKDTNESHTEDMACAEPELDGKVKRNESKENKTETDVMACLDVDLPSKVTENNSSDIKSETKAMSCDELELDSLVNKIESNENKTKNGVITQLLIFAEKLKEDCTKAPEANDFDLNNFLGLKSKEYKSIINSVLCAEASVQTEKVISKKKLRKINAQDKRLLLESSNDSDSSALSYIDKTLTELEAEYNSRKQHPPVLESKDCLTPKKSPKGLEYFSSDEDSDDECAKSDISQFNESLSPSSDVETEKKNSSETPHNINDTDDQIPYNGYDKCRGKSRNESDKENRALAISPEPAKSKHDEIITEDIQDKEIERLLNLKGLAEPQKNTSIVNNSKPHKTIRMLSSKTDSLYAVMQEIDKNSFSEDSAIEDSEQILTEKQFLVKCNENLKQQLLNSASSDSDNFNSDTDVDLIIKNNEHSEDEDHPLSYVDKFLETLIDNEDNSPPNNDMSKEDSIDKIVANKKLTTDVTDTNEVAIATNSETNRDTFGFKKKENSKKSFETLLLSDKRQKVVTIHEDLIDLSAESCNSDVEEYPAESKEKSQRIKPMLRQDQLESETIHAQKKEADRLRRLEKKNNFISKMLKSQNKGILENDFVLDYATVNKQFIKVHPEIVKHLKPHQRDGVKFMYDSCYGCADDLKENSGSGCILAHCMGLGKTLQIIALLHTVTSYKELKTSKLLVLCPKSTIMNWADEIHRWLGPLEVKNFQIFNFSDTADIYEKINVLRQWSSSTAKAGCLIMGYEAFRALVFYHSNKSRAKSNMRVEDIRANIRKYLLRPGADLVVCDEGHIIKNRKSGISLAAAEIVTPKRIILTGTPIQNNLKEYYSMVNFIKPLILGTEKEFANLYANPIKNGQHKDSSKRDIKVMKQRSFVLHKKLSKFVQRKEAVLLQSFLPQKYEYVLFIPMTDVQNNLYEFVLEAISKREDSRGRSLITDYTCLRKIWTHPKVLEDAWKNAIAAKSKKEPKKQSNVAHSDDDQPDDIYDSQTGVISVQRDWWRSLVTDSDLELILPSNKLKTMFEIIRMSEENAFVAVLNVVEYFFNKINDKQRNFFLFEMPEKTTGHWINGQDYYRLDGKTNKTLRHEMVQRFNDPKNKRARVFLISAKAGGQGINLIGANRVIILDTSWNPANDQQNIFRIFRLGQKKNCYVYRLIAMGTMEEKVYSRSVTKQAMSFRVVDEQQIDRHYNMAELAELYTLTKPCYNERPVPIFPQDQILANLLLNFPDLVYKYHEHDSLLENKVEQELSEQEKADAWVAYERDLQLNSEPRDAMEGYHGYPLFGQGNYMCPIGDFDPKNLLPGNCDLNQMDIATRNALGSSMLPNYMVNRNSYLDILNMYKNFSSSLLNEKSSRNSRFNSNYPMSLPPGMQAMCNPLPASESHLSALANPFYPLHSLANTNNVFSNNSLNSNPMIPSSNLSSSNQVDKNIISVDDSIASSIRNYPTPMSPFAKDLTSRSLQPKNLLHNPPSLSSLLHSPTRQLPQNIFSTNIGNEGIPRNVVPKKRTKVTSKSTLLPSGPVSEKSDIKESVLRSPGPVQNIGRRDPALKMFEQPAIPMPLNMGIVYPKQSSKPLSPVSEGTEGRCIIKSGSSMQIIPTHSPLTENVRKKFDNISPNISLTAVRTLPNTLHSEQLQPTTNSSHLEATPNNIRKRRNSFGTSYPTGKDHEQKYSSGKTPIVRKANTLEQPTYPPKVSKY